MYVDLILDFIENLNGKFGKKKVKSRLFAKKTESQFRNRFFFLITR